MRVSIGLIGTMTASALLLTIVGVSAVQQCPVWREIRPCVCRKNDKLSTISITCDKMGSFNEVVTTIGNHFNPSDKIALKLSDSRLEDLQYRKLKELNFTIESLRLSHDHLGILNEEAFEGLTRVNYLSLADTSIGPEIPEKLWNKLTGVKSIDLGRTKLQMVKASNFKALPYLETLILPGNQINRLDQDCIPYNVYKVHLGRNKIYNLNGTLSHLTNLKWLFINSNELEDIDNELPPEAPNLELIHCSSNRLRRLPKELKNYNALESLFFSENMLTSLDGVLAKSKSLERLVLDNNFIDTISKDDFQELVHLESLTLSNNLITTLNNSLLNLRNLNFLNMSQNKLTEFSFEEVTGLQEMRSMDLSYNLISSVVGPVTNLVEWDIKLVELKLDHNLLEVLNGALSGLPELVRLDLSFNKLRKISPEDFIGLDQLVLLDVSHNLLTTLEETSRTFLPRLSELKASHNQLTILEKDFHGLPVLCHADLSNNQIISLGRDLVAKTRCKIENGVHEGTWDTLKINLQENPILCDPAMPEIRNQMEINHTKICGVSQCPLPTSEQATTPKPNGFPGYGPDIPEIINQPVLTMPPIIKSLSPNNGNQNTETPNQIQPNLHPESLVPQSYHENERYNVQNLEGVTPAVIQLSVHLNNSQPTLMLNPLKIELNNTNINTNKTKAVLDPILQGQQITKLATEIEELRTRIDQLSSQNELLINKTIIERELFRPQKEVERNP